MKYNSITFGEILFDVVGDIKKEGGAPFNVAYHLQQLGLNTAMITRVGNDTDGKALEDFMTAKGVTTAFLQKDEEHITGLAVATKNSVGDMKYDIVQPAAWDFIQHTIQQQEIIKQADYFVFGSLSSRNEETKKTLLHLVQNAQQCVFDINMRPPFIDKTTIEVLLNYTHILKMNEEEYHTVCNWNEIDTNNTSDALQNICDTYKLSTLIVTRGSNGALLYHENKLYEHAGFKVEVKDTIGSGDAFIAGFLYAQHKKYSPEDALQFASQMGAFMATQTGGTPVYNKNEIMQIGNKLK